MSEWLSVCRIPNTYKKKTLILCHNIKLQSRWISANKWLIPICSENTQFTLHCFEWQVFYCCWEYSVHSLLEKINTTLCYSEQIKRHFSVYWNEIKPFIMHFFPNNVFSDFFFPELITYMCVCVIKCRSSVRSIRLYLISAFESRKLYNYMDYILDRCYAE